MVSAFSVSDSDILFSSSSSEESIMDLNGTVDNSTLSDVTSSINDAGKGGGRLVLVESGAVKDIKQEILEGEGEGMTGVDNKGEPLVWLKEFYQQFKALLGSSSQFNQPQLQEFKDAIQGLSLQMEALHGQMREMQLIVLKSTLSSQTTSPSSIKEEKVFKPQDKVFQTPKKAADQPMRLDVTPVSTNSDTDQHQNAVSSTVIGSSRRSLAFPKSLESILDDTPKENFTHDDNDVASRDVTMREVDVPTPMLSLVDIKAEPETNDSPPRDSNNLGLLVLADAALTHTPRSNTFVNRRMGESLTDYDSGRSSGNSCRSSPADEFKVKSSEKCSRYGVYNSNRDISITPELSSSSSTSYGKLRKRRKTKQPLPCTFCGKCFNNQSSLRQHESFHRPVRPFRCENENCDKAYKTRSELNRHLVVHSGEKKHECKLCGKRFLRKQYLKTHLLRHHETGIAMVAPSAIESFKNDSTGTIPSIVVSSSFVSKTEPLTWRCKMCFKIFVNDEDLSRHVRSYHDKKKSVEGKLDINAAEWKNNMMRESD